MTAMTEHATEEVLTLNNVEVVYDYVSLAIKGVSLVSLWSGQFIRVVLS